MSSTSDRVFRQRWHAALRRDSAQAPLLGPLFVAQLGAEVSLVDIRPIEEAGGVLGHVPGSLFLDAGQAPRDRAVVLVDADGQAAGRAALRLEADGHPLVAAMLGGLAAWRRIGLSTSRTASPTTATDAAPADRATPETVREQLADPRVVRWIQLGALVRIGHLSCIDGRDERGVVGTPGGDAGELVLQLAALEELTGAALDDRTVEAILLARLDTFGALYMHTDRHALDHLLAGVRADSRLRETFADVESVESLVDRIRRPTPSAQEALLDLLVEPSNVGCGHLRMVDRFSDEYGVRAGLAAALQRAAWRLLWRGSPEILITALSGGHEESAVLDVHLDPPPWALGHVPLIPPRIAGEQMFVHHADAVGYLRRANVLFLLQQDLPVRLEASRADELRETLRRLAARQLAATLRHLAAGLPVYEATFRADRSVDVRRTSG